MITNNEIDAIDWSRLVGFLEKFATSESAREKLRTLAPLGSAALASQAFSETTEALQILRTGQRPHMESLDLFSTWFQRLSRSAMLKTIELKDIRHFCLETMAFSEIIRPLVSSWIASVKDKTMDASKPLSAIDQIMTPEGEIRSDASEKLYQLHKEKKDQAYTIKQTLDRLVKAHQMEGLLQDRYVTTREGRWVLPIKSGMQHSFDGIIHAASQSRQTVFMEPKDIVPINNRLREIEDEIEKEIERLLTELTAYLCSLSSEFERTRELLLHFDFRLAQAQLALQLNASPCEFTKDSVTLVEVRHPVLVLQTEGAVVANTVELDEHKRILLLSGPNAGGKTILLKSIGLAAEMARRGLFICAEEGSKLPFFERVYVAVGDAQSVDAHLSTFAAHLKVLNEATKAQGNRQLLLIDEICGATDPEEGAALARSFILQYASQEVFGVITSHLGALKKGWAADSGVINGSLEYDSERGPTYQFLMGIPGQSLALQTARRVGVDETIVKKALELLSPEQRKYQEHIREVEEIKDELHRLRQDLRSELKQAKKEKSNYHALAQKLEVEKENLLKKVRTEAEQEVEKMIGQAKVDKVFRNHEQLEKMKAQLPQVIKSQPETSTPAANIETEEQFTDAFPPGSKIFVTTLSRDGVVQGKPNNKGEVPVLSDSMRLLVNWKLLKPPRQAKNPTREVLRKSPHYAMTTVENDRVIDLRGFTVDDAISHLEIQLDTASANHEDRVKIVHGHGTEALKRSIRSYLSRSVYVKTWKAGTPESGGDGVTWVELS